MGVNACLTSSSVGNKGSFEALLAHMQKLAEDVLDPASVRSSLMFLGRCVNVWGQPAAASTDALASSALPGFERIIYEQLLPLAFRIPSLPQFNPRLCISPDSLHSL